MKDPDLEAYVEAIEAHLGRLRRREHTLSPADFALARAWFGAGVPLAMVLVALDEAFAAGHRTPSLAFCRRRVKARVAAARRGAGGHGPV